MCIRDRLTAVNEVPQEATKFGKLFNEFYKYVGGSTRESELTSLIIRLKEPTNSRAKFVHWLQKLADVVFDHLDKHPNLEFENGEIIFDAVELVRILPGRFGGRRSLDYRVEREFLKRIRVISDQSDIAAIDDKDCTLVQSECLQWLQQTFSRSLTLRGKKYNSQEWLKNLRVNEWSRPLAELISDEVCSLATKTGRRGFRSLG